MAGMRDLWIKWKMLKLPWRKRFLVGQDLVGNTYWEFKDTLNPSTLSPEGPRMRRIVQARRRKIHHSDVQVSPQWHQWLRRTRIAPPTIEEQQLDLVRQSTLAHNARLADERWNAKKKYIEKPRQQDPPVESQPQPLSEVETSPLRMQADAATGTGAGMTGADGGEKDSEIQARKDPRGEMKKELKKSGDPWERQKKEQSQMASNPGATWQPETWIPGSGGGAVRRR